jgi:biopolymer transport protein ExbB/biopolymer transport protein TolQ
MDRTAMITVAELKENLGVLATIGATAPFVGLFGTVLGIIDAFGKMATSGGGIASVSAGISEALVTTAFGLFVAIPAVWAYNYFQNRIDRFTVEMSNSGSEMAIYFLKETGAGNEKASLG